jgi:hypothetical protein
MKQRIFLLLASLVLPVASMAQRETVNLNGIWDIEESVTADKPPVKFLHKTEVPGLANTAKPGFNGVDKFYSKEYYFNSWVKPSLEKLEINPDTMKTGYSFQKRNYFWYKKTFETKPGYEAVILRINKAQFGTMVMVNGKKAGEYNGCFSTQFYNITSLIKKKGLNIILIRIGAHPAVLPASVPAGNDFEKRHWTPGIYDDISLILTNYPYIETVQVAPDIHKKEIRVQSVIITKPGTSSFSLAGKVTEWKSGKAVSDISKEFTVEGTSASTVTFSIPVKDARLWSPEDPFLYKLNLSTGADDINVRFGMREFRFDTPTKRAYLNDKLYFLRGSNITLHRFFDDSLCLNHPWNEQWVRKLLTDLPKKYNWNSFRFCIGPVPDKWFDIADEAGLLIQNEYFIWSYRPYWDRELLKTHLADWMRDCWNHPSVAWWDINNETRETILTGLISELRKLDLSGRAWDNGYNLPEGDNDPVEDHNYKFYSSHFWENSWNQQKFVEGMAEKTTNSPHPTAHACVLNEYGWLWLKRNGRQTLLTSPVYDSIAKGYTNQQRQELYAYLLAAETEYFRAHRNYAGVLHFDYLTGDFKGAITGDIFKNPETLEPVKVYDEYFTEIFKPLGVYVNYFPVKVKAGANEVIPVMLVNDEYRRISGNIEMVLTDSDDRETARSITAFSVPDLSQNTYLLKINMPEKDGSYWLKTYAVQPDGSRTLCRRKIKIASGN